MTILLTGTHLTPALATIQALRRKTADARLVYVGRNHTGAAESVEKKEIERVGAEFRPMTFGKLHRHFSWRQILDLVKFPVGFWQAFSLMKRYKPETVVSFGGYISIPVVLAGKIGGARLVIHEQTFGWGAANKLAKRLADVKAVSWKEMEEPGVVWTGNPIRQEIVSIQEFPGYARRLLSKNPVLYITGGNQGSKTIDKVIEKILPDLVEKFDVFHQTKSVFGFKHQRYHSSPWFSTSIHAKILSRAAISVSRAGANTVTELMYLEIPSILIPLPYSAGGEQQKNAKMIVDAGLGKIIKQEDLSAERLLGAIGEYGGKYGQKEKKEQKEQKGEGNTAADKLAELIIGKEGLEG